MKRTFTKSLRSLLALLLVGCMMFGLCGGAVAAESSAADRVGNLLKELEDLLEEYGPKVLDEVYTYYDADTAELKAQAKALAAMLEEKLKHYSSDEVELLKQEIAEIKADVLNKKAKMEGMIADLKDEVAAMEKLLDDSQDVTAPGADREAIDEMLASVQEIKAELDMYENAYYKAIATAEAKIKAMEESLREFLTNMDALRAAVAELKTAVALVENFTGADYGADAKAAAEALKAATKDIFKQVKAVEEKTASFDDAVKACINVMLDVVNEAEDYAGEQYAAIREVLDKVLDKFGALEALFDKSVDVLKANAAGKPEVEKLVKEFDGKHSSAEGQVLKMIEEAEDSVKNLYAKAKAKAKELAEELSVLYGPIKEEVKEYVEKFYAAYERATTDDYHITKDSYYVAIGDDSAISESYVDALAAYLEVDYKNLAQEELTTKEAVAFVKANEADIKEADLITVGFSSAAVMVKALDHSGALDWARFVGDEGAVKVKQVLAKISAELAGSSQELADAVESYTYYCLSYAVHLPELVNEIRKMNPDAVIAIVGMYNELQNVSITMDGKELPVGNYFEYMIEASSMYGLVYAMLTANAIFVEVDDAEVVNNKTPLTPVQLVVAYAKGNMYPSEAGHEKIKQDILDALRITREPDGLLGDVNSDGVVNIRDSMRIAQYTNKVITADDLNLLVGDVNGDGVVNIRDAMLIAQYSNHVINKFPVE